MVQPPNPTTANQPALTRDEMLIAEFQYITQIAHNDSEDRARVSTFYLVSVGSILAALLSASPAEGAPIDVGLYRMGFFGIFAMLTILGWTTIFQLVRLRFSWARAIEAMNTVKGHYISQINEKAYTLAFKWQTDDGRAPSYKFNSLGTIMAAQVGLVSSLTLGGAIIFALLLGNCEPTRYLLGIAIAIVAHLLAQTSYYVLRVKYGKE